MKDNNMRQPRQRDMNKEIIILPNLLCNPVYVSGFEHPLGIVADILDEQGKHEYAIALRNAATICTVFTKVNLLKNAKLIIK